MSGYDVNTGELVAAAGSVRAAADPLRDTHSKHIAELGLGQADFGRVHGQHFSGYQAGMDKLSSCVASMADAMDSFAEKLEKSGSGYDWSDQSASETVAQSRG